MKFPLPLFIKISYNVNIWNKTTRFVKSRGLHSTFKKEGKYGKEKEKAILKIKCPIAIISICNRFHRGAI